MSEGLKARFKGFGLHKRLLMLLTAVVCEKGNGEIRIPAEALDNVETGEGLTISFENSEVVLRYQPEGSEMLVVDEAVNQWQRNVQQPGQERSRGAIHTDADLAQIERAQASTRVERQEQPQPLRVPVRVAPMRRV